MELVEVYKQAAEQSVVGLVATGLEHVVDGSFSKSEHNASILICWRLV